MSLSDRLASLDRVLLGNVTSPADETAPSLAPYERLFVAAAVSSAIGAVVLAVVTLLATGDVVRLGVFLGVGAAVGGMAGVGLGSAQRDAVDVAPRRVVDLERIAGASSASRLELAAGALAVVVAAVGVGGIDFGVMPHTLSAVLVGLAVQGALQARAVRTEQRAVDGTALYPSRALNYEGRDLVVTPYRRG
jgi:hypothetical protein